MIILEHTSLSIVEIPKGLNREAQKYVFTNKRIFIMYFCKFE